MPENEIDETLIELEQRQLDEDDSDETPPSDIVAFNEQRSCADLFRMYTDKQLDISPDFQRNEVWKSAEKTRFIDSLVKQLPIPSICISFDYKTQTRLVVDGLQRISSIVQFFENPDWRLSKLTDIDKRISNKTVSFIKKSVTEVYSSVENTSIPVTVLRCDLSKRSHQEYLFTIFHRLNSGGIKLNNQEIRNCIFEGPFNKLLRDIVKLDVFQTVFSIEEKKEYRFANEELVLRIMALDAKLERYKGPLTKFLNDYMNANRHVSEAAAKNELARIKRALDLVYYKILQEEPLPRLSKATTEAIFVGILQNIELAENSEAETLQKQYQNLRSDPLFSVDALKEGLAAQDKVKARLKRAIEIFREND